MIRVKDNSGISGCDGRILCVEQTTNRKDMLAIWPDRAPGETVWLNPDDAAELAVRIADWAALRGGKPYPIPARNLTGDINLYHSMK